MDDYDWDKTKNKVCGQDYSSKSPGNQGVARCKELCLKRPDKCKYGFSYLYNYGWNQCRFPKKQYSQCRTELGSWGDYYKLQKKSKQLFCPDPSYLEFLPTACYWKDSKEACTWTTMDGYKPDSSKCHTLFKPLIQQNDYDNDLFFSIIKEALTMSRQNQPDNYLYIQLKDDMNEIYKIGCILENNKTDYFDLDKCINSYTLEGFYSKVRYIYKISKNPTSSQKSICNRFKYVIDRIVENSRNLRGQLNSEILSCTCKKGKNICKGIKLYSGTNYGGSEYTFNGGSYNENDNPVLHALSKSIKIPSKCKVTTYSKKNFTGSMNTFYGPENISDLGSLNNTIRSLSITDSSGRTDCNPC